MKLLASDCLTMYPLLRRFTEIYLMDFLPDRANVFLALCDVADALAKAKHQQYSCRRTMANQIRDLVHRYLKARQQLDGDGNTIPKHHCLSHLSDQLLLDGLLLDTWVLERMHLLLKGHEEHILHSKKFEQTVITRAVLERTRQLQNATCEHQLIGPQIESHAKQLLAKNGQRFCVNDLVFPCGETSRCCLVRACFGGETFSLVLLGPFHICVALLRRRYRRPCQPDLASVALLRRQEPRPC